MTAATDSQAETVATQERLATAATVELVLPALSARAEPSVCPPAPVVLAARAVTVDAVVRSGVTVAPVVPAAPVVLVVPVPPV